MTLIRPVEPNEAGLLTAIALAAKRYWGYPEHWIEIWTPQLTFTPEYFESNESWAALVDDRPVGFYTLLEVHGIASLENLWVAPEIIGKGIGRRLFLHAVELAQQRGFQVLQLEADPNAVGFYEKMGMDKVGEHHSKVDGQHRILPIMELKL